jgi:hypothetical protein
VDIVRRAGSWEVGLFERERERERERVLDKTFKVFGRWES